MPIDFFNLSYLEQGSSIQKRGHEIIRSTYVMEALADFNPVLVGTLPLDIFIEGSDLDILCSSEDLSALSAILKKQFSHYSNFEIHSEIINDTQSLIANFIVEDFPFELFAQNIPTREQVAYRHLLIEDMILHQKGAIFKEQVIKLKKEGMKTEPAFAKLLGLKGDPYAALLQLS